MNVKALRELRWKDPFKPFRLHISDGRNIPVDRAEYMAISPAGRAIFVWERDESYHVVDIPMITEFEYSEKVGED